MARSVLHYTPAPLPAASRTYLNMVDWFSIDDGSDPDVLRAFETFYLFASERPAPKPYLPTSYSTPISVKHRGVLVKRGPNEFDLGMRPGRGTGALNEYVRLTAEQLATWTGFAVWVYGVATLRVQLESHRTVLVVVRYVDRGLDPAMWSMGVFGAESDEERDALQQALRRQMAKLKPFQAGVSALGSNMRQVVGIHDLVVRRNMQWKRKADVITWTRNWTRDDDGRSSLEDDEDDDVEMDAGDESDVPDVEMTEQQAKLAEEQHAKLRQTSKTLQMKSTALRGSAEVSFTTSGIVIQAKYVRPQWQMETFAGGLQLQVDVSEQQELEYNTTNVETLFHLTRTSGSDARQLVDVMLGLTAFGEEDDVVVFRYAAGMGVRTTVETVTS